MNQRSPNPPASAENSTVQHRSAARYLALDVGTRRIGVAISDPLGLTAQPLLTVTRKNNPKEDLRSLSRLARQHACSEFVVGLPLRLSGESSEQTERVRRFASQLADYSNLPVRMWDERLTTQEAHSILYASGKKRQQHAPLVDQVAAALILQSFLDHPSAPTSAPDAANEPNPDQTNPDQTNPSDHAPIQNSLF